MSECVVRMEMPKNCFGCDLRYGCNVFYAPGQPKPFMKGCMIVCQLPEGHGRLGDLDELGQKISETRIGAWCAGQNPNPYWECGDIIASEQTIVPAERSETEQV